MLSITSTDISYAAERPEHDLEIEQINAEAFGPGRFTRAAYRIREGGEHERPLSFVALHRARVIASVRMTRVVAGQQAALLLGPLAVRPDYKNRGIGRRLVAMAVDAGRRAGAPLVVLVGDAPYYGPLGFGKIAPGQVTMPRPVDPNRLLAIELEVGALARLRGVLRHGDQGRPVPADGT